MVPHTSISQLKCFIQCPRKYYFQYVVRAEPAFRPLALVVGIAWHETIGVYLAGVGHGPLASIEELKQHLRDGLTRGIEGGGIPVLFDEDLGAADVIDLGMKMLDVFVAKVVLPAEVLGVEVPFSMDLGHPITGEILPIPVVGAIDALVVEDGSVTVLELKTAKRRWASDQLEFDLQMSGYKMAARTLGHGEVELKLLVTTKTKVPDVQLEQLVRHRRDEREFAEVAFGVHRAINAGADHPLRGWQCRGCPYADACGA